MTTGRVSLMGMETEFGFSALNEDGIRCDSRGLSRILSTVRAKIPNMSCTLDGCFLSNGGLLYVDTGKHLEWATPECMSPRDVVMFQRAAEKTIAAAADELVQAGEFSRIQVFKGNVCFTTRGISWGCHESYLYRNFRPVMAKQLIPFLASRLIFTGAGGLLSCSSGIVFDLSPRVAHLESEVGNNSMHERPIFHNKNETLSRFGYNRLHLICGDSNCSQFQTWLKLGTTMLVVALVDAGLAPGESVQLKDAVAAMRFFSADPGCSMAVADDCSQVTALEIQYHYLEMSERYLGTGLMPDWAEEVCVAWRATLNALAKEPMSLSDKLDWPLKHALFKRHIERHSIASMENVDLWNAAIEDVEAVMSRRLRSRGLVSADLIKRNIRRPGPLGGGIRCGAKRLAAGGFRWRQLDEFMDLRWQLCELDMAFSDISDRGLFNVLDQSGSLNQRIIDEELCELAVTQPPAAGRAKVRGEAIRSLFNRNEHEHVHEDEDLFDFGRKIHCSWQFVYARDRYLDLTDPLTNETRWTDNPRKDRSCDPESDIPAFLIRNERGERLADGGPEQ